MADPVGGGGRPPHLAVSSLGRPTGPASRIDLADVVACEDIVHPVGNGEVGEIAVGVPRGQQGGPPGAVDAPPPVTGVGFDLQNLLKLVALALSDPYLGAFREHQLPCRHTPCPSEIGPKVLSHGFTG